MIRQYGTEYWRELYLTHAGTNAFKKKVEKSMDIIARFLDLDVVCYGSVSGGKDSTAMMHLINEVNYGFQYVSVKDGMDFPGEVEYLRELASMFGLRIEILTPRVDLWEVVKDHDFTEDIHSKGTSFSDDYFYGVLKEYQTRKEYKGVFLGLRAAESNGRRINRAKNGTIYYNESWHQLVCQPLADWNAADVFAYLFSREIPILDVYFKTNFVKSPEEIRKSWVLPSAQSSKGQALWLKYYFPEIFRKLSIINPKMRTYV